MTAKIQNVGQLREFLSNMLVGVKDGDVKVDEARTMVKLAEKINESYYAEIKMAQMAQQLERKVAEFGKLPINAA